MAGIDNSKRITSDLLCLSLLLERDMYVYEMAQEIDRRSDELLHLAEAAIYMSMYRLAELGYVTDRRELVGNKGRVRVYYHITDSGKEHFQKILEDYKRSTRGIQNFFAYKEESK